MTLEQAKRLCSTGFVYNTMLERVYRVDGLRYFTDKDGNGYTMICRNKKDCREIVDADVLIVSLPEDEDTNNSCFQVA